MLDLAVIQSLDAANHQATVTPLSAPGGTTTLPVATACPIELLAADDIVLIARPTAEAAIVLSAINKRPEPPIKATDSDSTSRTFTAQAYTTYPDLSVTVTLTNVSRLLITVNYNIHNDAIRATAAAIGIYINSTQQGSVMLEGAPAATTWRHNSHSVLTGTFAAGTHTIVLKVYVYNAGDTVTMRYADLSVLAFPE